MEIWATLTFGGLGNFKKAIEYHNQDLTIAKELGDRAGEGRAFGISGQRSSQSV